MAIHPIAKAIEVDIYIDNELALEYEAENDTFDFDSEEEAAHRERVTITRYIESVTDKPFSIHISVQQDFPIDCPGLSFDTSLSDKSIDLTIMNKEGLAEQMWEYTIDSTETKKEDGRGTVSNLLKFSKIQTSDDVFKKEIVECHVRDVKAMGEISVEVHRLNNIERAPKYINEILFEGMEEGKILAHKAVLESGNKTHGASLGEVVSVEQGPRYSFDYLDGFEYPIAIFVFKYQSRTSLQELLIVPRSPCSDIEEISSFPASTVAKLASRSRPGPSNRRTAATSRASSYFIASPSPSSSQAPKSIKQDHEDVESLSSPSPPPYSIDEMTPEQRRDAEILLQQLYSARKSERARGRASASKAPDIKREREHTVEVKQEDNGEGKRKRRKKFAGKVTIDLTEEIEEYDSILLDE